MAAAYPCYADIETPLLRYIYEHGGPRHEVHASEAYGPLADHFNLTQEERSRTIYQERGYGADRPVWDNMVRYAKRRLKDNGYLAPSPHGIWRLSGKGVKASKAPNY